MSGDLIQTPQTRWIQGSYESVQLGSLILLTAQITNAVGETRYSALRIPGAAAGYQVTANKTLYITKLIFNVSLATAQWHVGSGTADAGSNQITTPAGEAAEDTETIGQANTMIVPAANTTYELNTFITIATGRYPFARGLTGSATYRIQALAHEE